MTTTFTPPTVATPTEKTVSIKAVTIGAAIAGAGAFLPWATVSAGFFSVSKNGIQGDGVITAVIAGIMLLLALTAKEKAHAGIYGSLSVIGAGIGAYDFYNVSSKATALVSTSVGVGLYATVIGFLICFAGTLKVWS